MSLSLNVRNPELLEFPGVAKWGAVTRLGGDLIVITVAAVYRLRDPEVGQALAFGTEAARVERVDRTKDNSLTTITARILSNG